MAVDEAVDCDIEREAVDIEREAQIRCDDLKSLSRSQDSMLRGLQKQILNVVQETAELTKATKL